jgi:hypothetical protein
MKKQFFFFLLTIRAVFISAQGNNILMRHDTTVLRADECQWMVNTPGMKKRSVPQAILEAIQSGKLKAFDPQTNEPIPSNKIFTWQQAEDTTMVWDAKKEKDVMKVIQNKINPGSLTSVRVYHDWYLNTSTGKLECRIKMFELIGEVRNPMTGDFMGYQPLYRIHY